MATANSTLREKPRKPRPDFPLTPHASGKWCKKIKGRLHYFGSWNDPQAALDEYLAQKDDLHAGRTPKRGELTVKQAINRFLTAKERALDAGEIARRTFDEYKLTGERVAEYFGRGSAVAGLRPVDFAGYREKIARTRGPVALGNEIQRVKTLFKWCWENDHIESPVKFGSEFKKPSPKTIRLNKARRGKKPFTRGEVLLLLDELGVHMRAMALLAINAGFGNADCGTLPLSEVDLDRGWIEYVRPKTGMARRCPLWPETVEALRLSLARRPSPKPEASDLFFVTVDGNSWAKETASNPVSKQTTSALKRAKIHRGGKSFYSLRHTFRTIADEVKDQPAADLIMGHDAGDMPADYRQAISDERLLAVTAHVRSWLFSEG